MERITGTRQDSCFEQCVPVVRLQGSGARASHELDAEWLPLLQTGPRSIIVCLDEMDTLEPEVFAALSRVLAQVQGQGGEMALVCVRPDILAAVGDWVMSPRVPILPDVDRAVLSVCDQRMEAA